MAGDIESLEAARRARDVADATRRNAIASLYVTRAEEALALLPTVTSASAKAALCAISENWLGLAEAELLRPSEAN